MYLSNKERIKKCISYTNECFFKNNPPKKPFFLLQSKSEYIKNMVTERENKLFARLEVLMKPSGQITLSQLCDEFGSRESEELLLEWVKILSSTPEVAAAKLTRIYQEEYKKLYQQQAEQKKRDEKYGGHRYILYTPVAARALRRLDGEDLGIES